MKGPLPCSPARYQERKGRRGEEATRHCHAHNCTLLLITFVVAVLYLDGCACRVLVLLHGAYSILDLAVCREALRAALRFC